MAEEIDNLDMYVNYLIDTGDSSDESIYFYKGSDIDEWSKNISNKDETGFIYRGYIFLYA